MRRLLPKILLGLVFLVGLVFLGGYAYLRRSLPQVDGSVKVAGISAPVDIFRDADSITHVYGATKLDAFYGLGYAHAQDRLWQMEFQRRVGMGRLSEVFGQATVSTDRFLRTLGTGRAARSAWDALPAESKTAIDAYVAGVNAFISTHHGSALPLEFTILRFEPEPWSGPDVLAWVKMMAWDLSKNYSLELLRHDLMALVGTQKSADLFPPYAADGLTILSDADIVRGPERAALHKPDVGRPFQGRQRRGPERAALQQPAVIPDVARPFQGRDQGSLSDAFASAAIPGFGSALGSNNWVVDGTMTASGKPLLANDPHLDAQIPSLWYLAHLSAPGYDVIGATLPGAPVVVIGRNTSVAWGETNVMADVQDLYREHIDATGRFAEFRGAQEPMRIVKETIVVKGEASIALDVRITRHGPLISDAINATNAADRTRAPRPPPVDPIAFRWTALDAEDSTFTAMLHLNDAHNWTEFTAALRDFIVPQQNFVYADVDGHIGYYAPGHFPVRASGDGLSSVDGWTGEAEWTGWVPFDELPHAFDPPEHFIVTANNKIVPPSYPHAIGGEWSEPYRAQRIVDRLKAKSMLTPDDFASIQADTYSLHAKALLPVLLQRVHPIDAQDTQAVTMLRQWNFDARGDSAASAIFQAWYYELPGLILEDELGSSVVSDYRGNDRSSYRSRFILNTLATKDSPWCDDVRTPEKESCDDTASKALHSGIARLTKQLGSDMGTWRWDAVHHAVFAHSTLDTIPVLGRWLRRTMPHGGDWSTIDVGPVYAPKPFDQHALPGYRQIVDLSPANDSRFLDAVGQSGHVLSPHYDDALPLWAAGKQRKMRMDRSTIEPSAIGHLTLTPR